MLNGGGYESFPGLAVTFILLSSQFPSRFLVILILDRFLNSQIVRILVKGALIIALFGIKPFTAAQFV